MGERREDGHAEEEGETVREGTRKRETVCLFLEAVTGRLIRSGPFHTPTIGFDYLILYIILTPTPLSIRGYLLRYASSCDCPIP